MPETLTCELRGGDFNVEVLRDGQGPPLVYLHGAIGQKGWAPFLGRLAQNFTVYAPYLPGYGNSTGLEHLDDVTDLTLCQFELLDALGVSQAHIVGHFFGGMIAAEMAALSPSYIGKLVLAAPAGLWNDSKPVADLISMSTAELQDSLWSAASSSMGISAADFEANAQLRTALSTDRMQDLSVVGKFTWPIPDRGLKRRAYRIKSPTLLIWGEKDQINPPSYADEFKRLISDAQISILPNTGHLLMLERSEAFADVVTNFLSS